VGIKAKVKAKVEVENWNIIPLRICQYGRNRWTLLLRFMALQKGYQEKKTMD
jgi:hypothetical protein